ncbi:hypothetical protein EBB07_00025 [Paenibacillaceae bacterium]|nr:hypothetical protein EBB07_00025 [Paenibacillaceae bacterium]
MSATIHLKRRIERFYDDESGETLWVMYEDTSDYIHYRYIGYDGSRHTMLSQQFYKQFTLSELQASPKYQGEEQTI